jgi:hypothetical protein
MSHVPVDPTKPSDPVRIPRRRPDTVRLATALMVGGALLGFINSALVIAAAGSAERDFRTRAGATHATVAQVDAIASGLQLWSLMVGVASLLLAGTVVALAVRVRRGSNAARVAAICIVCASICCGLGWSSFTVRGSANLRPDGMDADTTRLVAEALGLSMSGLPTYVGGGLTCLQVLGYIAVLVLLPWPASNPYFRKRAVATVPEVPDPVR